MSIPKATHTGELNIGPVTIECAVLEDGTRVLTQSDFLKALGRSKRPSGRSRLFDKVAPFLSPNNLKPFISSDLISSTKRVEFRNPSGKAYGYMAVLLPQVCEVYLQARDSGALLSSQMRTATACEILMRGLAQVGIIAMVDEATSYQEIRDRKALNKILDKYLLAEQAKWAKRFPDDFYKGIFKLRVWPWQGMKVNRPQVVGRYTNDIVWDRIAPGVRTELETLNPKTEDGARRSKHHQWLTPDIGHPALQKHLAGVMALMRAAPNWDAFKRMLQRAYPKINTNLEIPYDE